MSQMTAEQAFEPSQGLTIEKILTALAETRKAIQESSREADKRSAELDKQIAETSKSIKELKINYGGLSNALGSFTEAVFKDALCKEFNKLGYSVSRHHNNSRYFDEDNHIIAEIDIQLEDGDIIFLVEVKTKLMAEFIDDHIKRIEKVRLYMDKKDDNRKIIGAVAFITADEGAINYAHKKPSLTRHIVHAVMPFYCFKPNGFLSQVVCFIPIFL